MSKDRVRLSLECKQEDKDELVAHGTELGEWSLIGTIRHAVRRSRRLLDLEKTSEGIEQRESR